MIDDYKQAMELMDMMNEHIPIPARVTKAFVFSMRDKGIKIPTREDVHIDDVLYLGDVGGIGCALRLNSRTGYCHRSILDTAAREEQSSVGQGNPCLSNGQDEKIDPSRKYRCTV